MTTPELVLPLAALGGYLALVWWIWRELDA
jgi:hypothetical protein